jgi:hypothetical protein
MKFITYNRVIKCSAVALLLVFCTQAYGFESRPRQSVAAIGQYGRRVQWYHHMLTNANCMVLQCQQKNRQELVKEGNMREGSYKS